MAKNFIVSNKDGVSPDKMLGLSDEREAEIRKVAMRHPGEGHYWSEIMRDIEAQDYSVPELAYAMFMYGAFVQTCMRQAEASNGNSSRRIPWKPKLGECAEAFGTTYAEVDIAQARTNALIDENVKSGGVSSVEILQHLDHFADTSDATLVAVAFQIGRLDMRNEIEEMMSKATLPHVVHAFSNAGKKGTIN